MFPEKTTLSKKVILHKKILIERKATKKNMIGSFDGQQPSGYKRITVKEKHMCLETQVSPQTPQHFEPPFWKLSFR